MTTASIDISRLRELVTALVVARASLQQHRQTIATEVLAVDLTAPGLLSVMGVESWVDDQIPGLRRRLAVAESIEAQTPGISVVTLDECLISTATPEQAREDARRAAELIAEHGITPGVSEEVLDQYGIPPELLTLLEENALDPYFAHELAQHTSPEEVADLVVAASRFRDTVVGSQEIVVTLADYDVQYETLLSGLGESLGLATRGTDELRLSNDWRDRWVTAATDFDTEDLAGSVLDTTALSLVMSRGTWGTSVVYEVANGLYAVEKLAGPEAWTGMAPADLAAPGGDRYSDPLAGVLAAVAADPDAAQWLFDDSTVATVTVEGEEVRLDGFLEHCLRRQWPSDDGAALMAALATATTPFEGGSTVSGDIATEARALVEQITAEYDEAVAQAEAADRGWFSDWGHAILDVLGLVPLLGEPADGINAIWYSAEGNALDAGLSAAGMIPVAGWVAVGGKWTRRVLDVDELAALGRQLDGTVVNAATVRGAGGPPTGGVFRREKPEWLARMLRGKEFEAPVLDEVIAQGGATQLRVLQPQLDAAGKPVLDAAGKPVYRASYPYNVIDGYIPNEEILEVKHTQFAEVTEAHGLAQLRALANKYPPGAPVADVPSTPAGLAGQPLDGERILVVPVQNAPIPQRVLDRARELEITIRDSAGKEYP